MWTFVAVVAVASALAGVPLARPAPGSAPAGRVDRFGLALAGVLVLLWLNQVAFNAYVVGAQGGRTTFFDRTFPAAFFSRMAPDDPAVRALLAVVPDPRWLAPSALRVQAVLELPFAALAYLSVARMVDRSVARQIAAGPLGVGLCVSQTLVLCAIELLLANRFTVDDLVLRVVALLLTVPLLRALAGPAVAADAPSAGRLVAFALGLAGMGLLVMGTNLVALLYNLGWLRPLAGPLAGAAVAVGVAGWIGGGARAGAPDGFVAWCFAFGRRFTLLFAVPALAVRYAASRPQTHEAAAVAFGLVVTAALVTGTRDAWQAVAPADRPRWTFCFLGATVGAGAAVTVDLARLTGLPALDLPDVWMLQKAAAALVGLAVGWGLAAGLGRRAAASVKAASTARNHDGSAGAPG